MSGERPCVLSWLCRGINRDLAGEAGLLPTLENTSRPGVIRPIHTEADHAAALARINALQGATPGTLEHDEIEVLGILIAVFKTGGLRFLPDFDIDDPGEPNSERIITPMPKSLVKAIDDYRFAERSPSRAEAIRRLIELGLKATTKRETKK